jgi:hypothetical protein
MSQTMGILWHIAAESPFLFDPAAEFAAPPILNRKFAVATPVKLYRLRRIFR